MKRSQVVLVLVCVLLLLVTAVLVSACGNGTTETTATTGGSAPASTAPAPTAPAPTETTTSLEPYKLGLVVSETGPVAGSLGIAARDASLAAVDEINAAGGVNGHQLELIVYNDESDPSKGVLAAKKLINEDKVLAMLGPVTTGIAMPVSAEAEGAGIPLFAENASTLSVVDGPWVLPDPPPNIRKWVFKLGIDPVYQFVVMYKMMKEDGVKKIAFLSVDNGGGKAFADTFKATAAQAGFEAVAYEQYGPADTDMTPQLTKLRGMDFDALIIGGIEMAGGLAYKQARELGITKPIYGLAPLVSNKIVSTLGASLDGIKVPASALDVGPLLPADDPQKQEISKLAALMAEKFDVKKPDLGYGCGWDGVMIVAAALGQADPDPTDVVAARAAIRDALEGLKGFVGTFVIGDMSQWHEVPAPFLPAELKNGQLEIIGEKSTFSWSDLGK